MSASPLSVRRFRNIFIISWLIIAIDLGLVIKWFGLTWKLAMIDSVVSNLILVVACVLVMNILRYYRPRRERYLNILAWCIFLTFLWLMLCRWLLNFSLGGYPGYSAFLKESLPLRASIGLLLMGCVILITVVWFNSEDQQENEQRKRDAEKMTKEAELFKLRQQLQPHFLFNSLNSINALIGSRPEEARKMVQQLSDFLRGTLKKEEIQWVNLTEELQYLQLYLDIEKVRFGNRLSAVVESDESSGKMKIPALLLQPIVENAIKFGLYDTMGESVIIVKTFMEDHSLIIKVSNPYDPVTSASSQGTGFGLKSVQRRLYLLFGRTDLLSTEVKENIFTTSIRVPQGV